MFGDIEQEMSSLLYFLLLREDASGKAARGQIRGSQEQVWKEELLS